MKFLSVAALIALCVGLFAGAALAATDSWDVTGSDFPPALVWDTSSAVSVEVENTGTSTWDSSYVLKSVEGITGAAVAIDRWGLTSVPVAGTVAPAGTYMFEFRITEPPITSVAYLLPITPTSVAAISAFDSNWILTNGSTPILTDTAVARIPNLRFPDTFPGTVGAWAAGYIEEIAGRVPLIVGGYPDGTYGPSIAVTRDQMAVFMQRAMELTPGTYADEFSDVISPFWAETQIQACVDAGIVGGYSDGTYRPALVVNRDAMAVFVARGMAGGESGVPTGPGTARFPDVPVGYWAYDHVAYAVANSIVGGYPDGTYRPTNPVTRDQMAVFVYRATIQADCGVVVLAGPAVTAVDVASAGYDGWSSVASFMTGAPADAYVGFDAVKACDADIDVTFELRDAATPTTAATGLYKADVTITAADVATAAAAAAASGNPYLYATWDIPAGLDVGDYILVTTVNGVELTRKPAVSIWTTG